MESEDVPDKELRCGFYRYTLVALIIGDVVALLSSPVDNRIDSVISLGLRKAGNKVYSNILLASLGYGQGNEQSIRLRIRRLAPFI